MHTLSADEKSKIHAVYVAIYNLPYHIRRKNLLLTALLGGAEWSWRVIGITPAALKVVEANDYRYVKGALCRAHLVGRLDTARTVFEAAQPLSAEEFFRKTWENDRTIIATKSENKTGGTLPKSIPIDYELGLFRCNSVVGWKHSKKEAEHLRQLHIAHKAHGIVTS